MEVLTLESFEDYVSARGPMLFRLAVMLTGNRSDAEDLVQSALLRAHGQWPRISSLGAVDAYIRRIVINEHISYLRRKRRALISLARIRRSSLEATSPTETRDPSSASVNRDAMWQALAALPPKQRAVLVLRYYEDLTDREIAEVLQCSDGTVRSNAFRALQNLRRSMGTPRKEMTDDSARH